MVHLENDNEYGTPAELHDELGDNTDASEAYEQESLGRRQLRYIDTMSAAEMRSALNYLAGYTPKGIGHIIELTEHTRIETRTRPPSTP